MAILREITQFLDKLCPPLLAEEWDNVGLLVGDPQASISRVMTCLTVTSATVGEAIAERAQLIVTHHPLPFRPLTRLTTETPEGEYLLRLIAAGIAIYSPHTAFDSAAEGINQRLAAGLQLQSIAPLVSRESAPAGTGTGRVGTVPSGTTLGELAVRAKALLRIEHVQIVGDVESTVRRVAVACGSAGELLSAAHHDACDCLVTGEVRFHGALEAQAAGIALLLVGHFASERFGVEELAGVMGADFPDLSVWASRAERDPIEWV